MQVSGAFTTATTTPGRAGEFVQVLDGRGWSVGQRHWIRSRRAVFGAGCGGTMSRAERAGERAKPTASGGLSLRSGLWRIAIESAPAH